MALQQQVVQSVPSSTLAEILERILDKGIVIAGDIKIKLLDIELLTIQIRLMIASVDKAREMGMDWWVKNPDFNSRVNRSKAARSRRERALPGAGHGPPRPAKSPENS